MNDSIASLKLNVARIAFCAVLATGTLTVLAAHAHAKDLDPITLSPPAVKTVGRDESTGGPIEVVTVKAHIAADKETLRNDSGVVLLHDRVLEAAHKACLATDPFASPDACTREAVSSAAPQVKAAIAQARASSVTN
jgi:secreted trypsin-like serine protease